MPTQVWKAEDGEIFETQEAAYIHEEGLRAKELERKKRFLDNTFTGKRLLEKHWLGEEGMWQVLGEDPNCDMGGHHHMPDLGIYEGKLESVIEYAVNLDRFWTWGGGGDIRKIDVLKV